MPKFFASPNKNTLPSACLGVVNDEAGLNATCYTLPFARFFPSTNSQQKTVANSRQNTLVHFSSEGALSGEKTQLVVG
jgi:hypothetical protein